MGFRAVQPAKKPIENIDKILGLRSDSAYRIANPYVVDLTCFEWGKRT